MDIISFSPILKGQCEWLSWELAKMFFQSQDHRAVGDPQGLSCSFYRWRQGGPEKSRDFPKVILIAETELKVRTSDSTANSPSVSPQSMMPCTESSWVYTNRTRSLTPCQWSLTTPLPTLWDKWNVKDAEDRLKQEIKGKLTLSETPIINRHKVTKTCMWYGKGSQVSIPLEWLLIPKIFTGGPRTATNAK